MRAAQIALLIREAIPTDATDFEAIEALHRAMDQYIGSHRYDLDYNLEKDKPIQWTRPTFKQEPPRDTEYRVCVCNRIPCECESN